jgi:LPXTG-site transpeptidase (sortase) family protein
MRKAAFTATVILVVGAAFAFSFTRVTERDQAVGTTPRTALSRSRSVTRVLPPSINIPRLHLKSRIYRYQDSGPTWWPNTGRPGHGRVLAIAGHRTTHTRPFRYISELRPGDVIYIRWGRVHRYVVHGKRVYRDTDRHIMDSHGREELRLSTCTPPGSARFRLVVFAKPA